MKTIANKQLVVGADFAGLPLKDAIVAHLENKGWEITDVGVKSLEEPNPEMYHRVGFKVGALVSTGEFERGLIFCGTGMGIHLAANKCPGVQCAVVESIPAAKRCVTANNCNMMAMGAFYVTPLQGKAMAEAFLENEFGGGYEDWDGFYEYHKIGYDEVNDFDFDAYVKNGMEVPNAKNHPLAPQPKDLVW